MSFCVRRTFSEERGQGAFHSLGVLPKRKSPVFHIGHDDDDDSLDEHAVPFPRSPSSSSSPSSPSSPRLSRGDSSPILLSNGKPLKSSLKSSSSSPAVLSTPPIHLRSRSEPPTPLHVHFPEKENALATVRFFNCKARPASLSANNSNGEETETEGEDNTPPSCFPFPITPAVSYEIDATLSSLVPCKFPPHANVLLETLDLSSSSISSAGKPLLTGTVMVRNLAFEKHVTIRFTLDDWQTVSEVIAHFVGSISHLPSSIVSVPGGREWDRFTFTIRLEDYAQSLSTRTMWLAARYRVTSTYPEPGSTEHGPGGEWWDNNWGSNYRLGFRPATTIPRIRPRRETIAAPIISPRAQLQLPTTTKEHALGLVIPSISNKKETHLMNPTEKHSVFLRTGKLNLCNYVPPTVHPTSSISFPSMGSPPGLSPTSVANPELPPPATSRPPSVEDSTSPASSTLSTPSVSPTIPPRVIIGGHLAASAEADSASEKEDDDIIRSFKSGHIADWDWSAPGKPRVQRSASQQVPVSDTLSSPGKNLPDNSLYNAFVTQWCFAQGPSPNYNGFGDGGIMA